MSSYAPQGKMNIAGEERGLYRETVKEGTNIKEWTIDMVNWYGKALEHFYQHTWHEHETGGGERAVREKHYGYY